ncbi:MAG: hypothetical protein H0U52_08725 [Chloroflexi bacterium]|nr:hypothetical protein [Chloroflexota bacterium]
MPELKIESLLAALHAQRREIAYRAEQQRGSSKWIASTRRLDAMNEWIMRDASRTADRREGVGAGVELELDSSPEEDIVFRHRVIECFRRAVAGQQRVTGRAAGIVDAAERRIRATGSLIRQAEVTLRRDYPYATLASPIERDTLEATLLIVRANREGQPA